MQARLEGAMLAKIGRLLSGNKSEFFEFHDDTPEFRPVRPAHAAQDSDPFRSSFWQDSIQEWLNKLDDNLRPVELTERYPRITAKIMTHWTEQESLESYMDSLVHDRRGGRQGFPGSIPMELARLYAFVTQRSGASDSARQNGSLQLSPSN